MAPDSDIITIEILGTRLQLRGGDNPDAVKRAGALVKDRVETLAEKAPTAPSLQLALLAAMNIADELLANADSGKEMDEAVERANRILEKASGSSR